MSTIPTVAVTALIYDQDGQPVEGAEIEARLESLERYKGLVVPNMLEVVTDAEGVAVMNLFPNELGTEGSEYRFRVIHPDGRTDTLYGVVPNLDCELHKILEIDRYELRSAGETLSKLMLDRMQTALEARNAAQASQEASKASEVLCLDAKAKCVAARDATFAVRDEATLAAQEAKHAEKKVKLAADTIATPAIISHQNGAVTHGGILRASEPRLAYAPEDTLKCTAFWMCSDAEGKNIAYPVHKENGVEHNIRVHLLQTNKTYYAFCNQETDKGVVSLDSKAVRLATADVLQFIAPPVCTNIKDGDTIKVAGQAITFAQAVTDPSSPSAHTKTQVVVTFEGAEVFNYIETDPAKLLTITLPFFGSSRDVEIKSRFYDEVRKWSEYTVLNVTTRMRNLFSVTIFAKKRDM
ncbi:hypothetical protein [Halodesulfovibrio sp.]|uniref:hypothetical protein n=1 Tax=Halodesulfovibrio sp. TaxID=1912772 RepID=UPI0025D2C18D|nr:hypothetical protein [Halodesulfovibrio sp.]MCT4627939.1 hypothetical protein [Halodesulfovibrio sp.]